MLFNGGCITYWVTQKEKIRFLFVLKFKNFSSVAADLSGKKTRCSFTLKIAVPQTRMSRLVDKIRHVLFGGGGGVNIMLPLNWGGAKTEKIP